MGAVDSLGWRRSLCPYECIDFSHFPLTQWKHFTTGPLFLLFPCILPSHSASCSNSYTTLYLLTPLQIHPFLFCYERTLCLDFTFSLSESFEHQKYFKLFSKIQLNCTNEAQLIQYQFELKILYSIIIEHFSNANGENFQS